MPNPPNIQKGAQYVQSLIDALMLSPSWKDSAFILTFDEFGGFYDHVPPQPAVSPDGIPPTDLQPGDICTPPNTGPTCDFVYTGYRVPLIVVSPFTKKNYVSHVNSSFPGMIKTVFRLLRLPPLNLFDATAADLSDCFTDTPDFTPYKAQPIDAHLFDPAKAREPLDPEPSPRMDDPREVRR